MLKFLLLALLAFQPDPETTKHNEHALATARAAVSEMIRVAKTPDEKALAEKDRQLVEQAAALLSKRGQAVRKAGAAAVDPKTLETEKQVQEAEMSFNLQYLQLQSQMQHENRSYTAISNIMKTKHETVKNSISNIR